MNETKAAVLTTIRLPTETWRRLRALAEREALERGGRPSVSAVISRLVEREASRAA